MQIGSMSWLELLRHQPLMVQTYLCVIIACLLFTLNGLRPLYRPMVLSGLSFFAGWPAVEAALQHIVWQLAYTVWVFHDGAGLHAWPGWLALGLASLNWIGLLHLARQGFRSRDVLRARLAAQQQIWDPGATEAELKLDPGPSALTIPLALPIFRPRSVERIGHVPYCENDGRPLHLDLYRPRARLRRCPVLLHLHGGGWVVGSKRQQGRPLMFHLASRGWICVSADYRLSPRATFPDPLHDAKQALRWIKEHIEEYGGDPDFVVVEGNSAGGHLAALLALTHGMPEYQPGFESLDLSVQGCVGMYGVYDLIDPDGLANPGLHFFARLTLMKARPEEAPELYERASPVCWLRDDAPPFLAVHGTNDTLVPVQSARQFVEIFRERTRVPLTYLELPGATHAFDIFHSPRANATVGAVATWLQALHRRHRERR